jgi:membrane-bound ClpP family serine protease
MGLVLIVIGLLVWLLTTLDVLGIVLIVIGVFLLFVPHTYGYTDYRGRNRGPRV